MEAITGIGQYAGISLDVTTSDGERRGSLRSSGKKIERRSENTDATGLKLSDEEKDAVRELQQRDMEVRTHEQAHIAASGGLAGGATFTQQRGPDGRMYAVGGEVNIDTSKEKDPDDTIAKAQKVRAAASAPAQPSSQDRAVAAQASQMEAEARQEKTEKATEKRNGKSSLDGPISLSGPPDIGGPASSVSGPPSPLNRRKDSFGNTDSFGETSSAYSADTSVNTARYQQARAGDDAAIQSQEAARAMAYAEADSQMLAAQRLDQQIAAAAAYDRQAMQNADAQAAYATLQAEQFAAQQAAGVAYADQQALLNADAAASYARTLDTYAMGGTDTANLSGAVPGSDPIDVSRAAGPAMAQAAGLYPQDRPASALFAAQPAPATPVPASVTSRQTMISLESSPQFQAAAASAQPSPLAMQRASQAYQRVGYTPTALAPYGTGISRRV